MTLLLTTAVIPLFVVAFASAGLHEVADVSPFGGPGTAGGLVLAAVVALIGVVVAWRGVAGVARLITAVALSIEVGIVAVVALYFVIGGGAVIGFAILSVLAAIMLGMIARAVLQAPSRIGS